MADTEDDSKPKTLAEFLGTTDTRPVEEPIDYESLSGQEFCKKVVASFEFRSYITSGLYDGTLPAAVVNKVIDHAWGKPPEKVEFEDKTKTLEALTPAELNQRLDAIAAILASQDA